MLVVEGYNDKRKKAIKVFVQWLDTTPEYPVGVTFGYPWPEGERKTLDENYLNPSFVQSWPLAYWPDGSIKWSGHAFVSRPHPPKSKNISLDKIAETFSTGINLTSTEEEFVVDTGCHRWVIAKEGNILIKKAIDINRKEVFAGGYLSGAFVQTKHDEQKVTQTTYKRNSRLTNVCIEQQGPIKVTIKMEGYLGADKILPFSLRLTFYNNSPQVQIIPTFFFNDDFKDQQLSELGFHFSKQLCGEAYNRHVRVKEQDDIYTEPSQLLASRRFRTSRTYTEQIKGDIISEKNDIVKEAIENAVFQDFSLVQQSAGIGQLSKRTNPQSRFLVVPTLKDLTGSLYAGGTAGGIMMGIKDFKESYPSALDVSGLSSKETTFSLWFYAPYGSPYDFRHYSDATHVKSAYEGFEEDRATPLGIARTSEAYLRLIEAPPSDRLLDSFFSYVEAPSLVHASSDWFAHTQATGKWPKVDRSTEAKAHIENHLDAFVRYYLKEIKHRRWYGFFDYGDVMHSYDQTRNQWFYDLGGYSWQNTELVPNLWLWYSFFRTEDSAIFRLVEAMTRHNSEVDRYHLGQYKGLGSRHNVSHWGCGCKELRISMACLYKYYYYLTADARMGDLLEEVKDAEEAIGHLDPMREFYDKEDGWSHMRIGPDWSSLTSNWMTHYERTQDMRYLNKIKHSLEDIKAMPNRLLSGPTMKVNLSDNRLHYMGTGNEGGYHMVIAFGAPQTWLELNDRLQDPVFTEMLTEFADVYQRTDQEKRLYSNGKLTDQHFHWPMFASGLIAFSGAIKKDNNLKITSWRYLLNEEISGIPHQLISEPLHFNRDINAMPWITTNVVAQWCLNVMMARYYADEELEIVFDQEVTAGY